MKKCALCKDWKDETEFSRHSRSKGGLNTECRKCRADRAKQYYSTHSTQENKRIANWQRNNPDKTKRYNKAWAKNNPEKKRIYCVNRRARVRKAGTLTAEEWVSVLNKYGNKCIHPGCQEKKVEIDHVVPLSIGGENSVNNVQPLCRRHNSSKHTKCTDYRTHYGGE